MITHLLGIRHHGPGSSKSVRAALKTLQPDVLLIESPFDAEPLLAWAGDPGLRPPVAMLVYDPGDFSRAAYYPFAEFSPEWQAIQYAVKQGIPIRFIDLPAANGLVFGPGEIPAGRENMIRRDPIGEIARLAGYSDGESWWDVTFEQEANELGIFEAVSEMMEALRGELQDEDPETLAREAFMRERIRQAEKDGLQNAAIICGAWHVPALRHWQSIPSSKDKAVLRGLAKTRIQATWMPWTHERLAGHTCYRAGVVAPAWYALLFKSRKFAVARWMSQAARLLRHEDLDASTAMAVDGVLLAENLAALRGRRAPGLDELREAAWSTICEGDPEKLALVEEKLIVGSNWGKVPADIPQVPLQRDLEACIRSARLAKEYKTIEPVNRDLDLRNPSNRLASRLLHRLNLLQIPWGKEKKGSRFRTGSFSEHWRLKWLPDYSIRIIEAGMWGNTVEEASSAWLIRQAADSTDLALLAEWLEEMLKAGLERPLNVLLARIQEQVAKANDILRLIDTLGPLVEIGRYGDNRYTAKDPVEGLIRELVPRICIGLLPSSTGITDELAESVFEHLLELNRLIGILDQESFEENYRDALRAMAANPQVHPLLQGASARLLLDRGDSAAEVAIHFHLSPRQAPDAAARWLEGFLHGSGLLLLHHPPLWQALDDWVDALPMDDLTELLPVLRRTFSRFSASERSKMLALARGGVRETTSGPEIDEERAGKVEELVLAIVTG